MEWKLFQGDRANVSTYEFHEHRERAPHLEQAVHRGRLEMASRFVQRAAAHNGSDMFRVTRVVDLGCGDGGLLQLLAQQPDIDAVGFDFQPSNRAGWRERNVRAHAMDFVGEWGFIPQAEIYTITECLEHLTDPHGMLRNIRARGAVVVASSPWTEHSESHDECHAWAWNFSGYEKLLDDAKFDVVEHDQVGMFQVIWGTPGA